MSKYLEFTIVGLNPKTMILSVESKRGQYLLGWIKWFGRWRQYAFFPVDGTVFNVECLNDIVNKIKELMKERRMNVPKKNAKIMWDSLPDKQIKKRRELND